MPFKTTENNMKIGILKIFILLIISFLFSSCGNEKNEVVQDTITITDKVLSQDKFFNVAYTEINDMLEEKKELDFKRAAFLVEWAYTSGQLDYNKFCDDINLIANKLSDFIKTNHLEQYKTAGNYALFEFFTKPNLMNGNKSYTYDFEDFTGKQDYEQVFITKLMRTHTGQCRSLPMFYKILCNEIGYSSHLAFAPNHLYIKHLGEDGKWVNVELTNGHLSTDAFIISSLGISAEAIKNGIYMDAITEKESVAHCLTDLSKAYQKKYGYDDFVLLCCETSIKYFPNNINALMFKHNALLSTALSYISKNGMDSSDFLKSNHKEFVKNQTKIEQLGYREISSEDYQKWLKNMENEKSKQSIN